MKLKNKKTGEIKDVRISRYEDSAPILVSETTPDENGQTQGWPYNSLAELNDEWEDYEEPKEYWCIDWTGGINHITVLDDVDEYEEDKKEIGNYFETKEEAEKAVLKLKAWERLRVHGLHLKLNKFQRHIEYGFKAGSISSAYDAEEALKDLDLLFGGEDA